MRIVFLLLVLVVGCALAHPRPGALYMAWTAHDTVAREVLDEAINSQTAVAFVETMQQALGDAYGVILERQAEPHWHDVITASVTRRTLVRVHIHEGKRRRAMPLRLDTVAHDFLMQHSAILRNTTTKKRAYRGAYSSPELRVILEDDAPMRYHADPYRVAASGVGIPWHLDRLDSATLDGAYVPPSGPGNRTVYVFVLDSGIDATHPWLAGRVRVLQYGGAFDALPRNCDGHGTCVASLVVGSGVGVTRGDARTVVVDVRVLDCDGEGSFATVTDGLMAVGDACQQLLHVDPRAAFVVNLSLGGASTALDPDTLALRAELDVVRAACPGITFYAAAGNSNSGVDNFYPAMFDGVTGVGATTPTDARATFSNWGPATVDVWAPGQAIRCAAPCALSADTCMTVVDGTSAATPIVSGVAAWNANRNASLLVDAQSGVISGIPAGTSQKFVHLGTEVKWTPPVFYGPVRPPTTTPSRPFPKRSEASSVVIPPILSLLCVILLMWCAARSV